MADAAPSSRFRALAELLRLPNVFTALADVAMGFLVTHASAAPAAQFALLAAASACLYLSGMVLNDYFDRDVDLLERPARPVPSGRITPPFARKLGWGLLAAGVVAGWTAGMLSASVLSGVVATLLAAMVVSYDSLLKRTPLGPVAMGSCRLLNVLLGMSAAVDPPAAMHWVIASGIGLYIVGVTLFARTEATESHRGQLAAALGIMMAGIALLAWFPQWSAEVAEVSQPVHALRTGERWYWFWGLMALMIGWRGLRAIIDPLPVYVQGAVKQCLVSLIVLDAAVCLGVRGPYYGAAIVLLILPTMLLGRWLYST